MDLCLIQVEQKGFFYQIGNNFGAAKNYKKITVSSDQEACFISVTIGNTWAYDVSEHEAKSLPEVLSNENGKIELRFTSDFNISWK